MEQRSRTNLLFWVKISVSGCLFFKFHSWLWLWKLLYIFYSKEIWVHAFGNASREEVAVWYRNSSFFLWYLQYLTALKCKRKDWGLRQNISYFLGEVVLVLPCEKNSSIQPWRNNILPPWSNCYLFTSVGYLVNKNKFS